MSEDFLFALALLVFGLAIIGVGAVYAFRQKIYYDRKTKTVVTEIELPLVGKVRTNMPAIAVCFVGLLPVVLASNQMKDRSPKLITFNGEVSVDPVVAESVGAVTVGVTSGSWIETTTPDGGNQSIKVSIPVPVSWQTYTVYGFSNGGQKTKPVMFGASLADPKFKIRIGP
jgi:hypothetical protein